MDNKKKIENLEIIIKKLFEEVKEVDKLHEDARGSVETHLNFHTTRANILHTIIDAELLIEEKHRSMKMKEFKENCKENKDNCKECPCD